MRCFQVHCPLISKLEVRQLSSPSPRLSWDRQVRSLGAAVRILFIKRPLLKSGDNPRPTLNARSRLARWTKGPRDHARCQDYYLNFAHGHLRSGSGRRERSSLSHR
jgi:hypothetical protein